MTRVHIFCEGQTEDVFVRELLCPYFERLGVNLNPIIIRTGPKGKGGISSYGKIKWQIERKCKEDPGAFVTTLLDFYALPTDFPMIVIAQGASIARAKIIEAAFNADIAQKNFVANLVVHEFEGLLFSSPAAFSAWFDDASLVKGLQTIRDGFDSPEHINDGKATAPSKRILKLCREYDKVVHGSLIALDIGLDIIRHECKLFDGWLKKIEALAPK